MSELQYYVIDTETTGLSSSYHEMTEISIIRCKDRVQISRNIKCEYPERASYDSLMITGKTLSDLDQGVDKKTVITECNDFFNSDGATPGHRVIIGHNVQFDRKFLHAMWGKFGSVFPADLWLCTQALTKAYYKKTGLKSRADLFTACDVAGIKKVAGRHSARSDSRNCYLLHKELVENKNINYLPLIKLVPHALTSKVEDEADFSIFED